MQTAKSEHSMFTIVHPINLLVSDEYKRAAGIHGAVFASPHEGYGVIAEEIKEAGDEVEAVERRLYALLAAIQEENRQSLIDTADAIRDAAVNGAAELIQVAAMCEKMVKTIQGGESRQPNEGSSSGGAGSGLPAD